MVPVYKQLFGSTCGSEPKTLIEKKKEKKEKSGKIGSWKEKVSLHGIVIVIANDRAVQNKTFHLNQQYCYGCYK